MKWTSEKPVVYGYYWYRAYECDSKTSFGRTEMLLVSNREWGLEVTWMGYEPTCGLSDLNGEWYGPIEPPK